MERQKRAKGKKLLGSHQKCWLWGRHAVMEALRAGRWPMVELYLSESLDEEAIAEARRAVARAQAAVKLAKSKRLTELCHSEDHQGYLAKMGPFPYSQAAAMLEEEPARGLFAILDRIQDPHNFGTIVRSAEVLGVEGIFIGEKGQVEVTSAVARSSAGAVNRVPIARVTDLRALARQMKSLGIAIVGTSNRGEGEIGDHDFRKATAVVIGNEGRGLREDLAEMCDRVVRIPQRGEIGSLNAAAAAAIFFYEALRQRSGGEGSQERSRK